MADEQVIQPGTGAEQAPEAWTVELDIDSWKMKDKRAFFKMINLLRQDPPDPDLDESILYPHLARMVKSWPYDLDPTNPESYDELTGVQFQGVLDNIFQTFQPAKQDAK